MILTYYSQLPPDRTSEEISYISTSKLFPVLLDDKPNTPTSKFKQNLREIQNNLGKNVTNAEKIILSLCIPIGKQIKPLKQTEQEIRKLIEAYKTENDNTLITNEAITQNVLSGLDSIEQLLQLERQYPPYEDPTNALERIEQLVREFSDAYKSKLEKQKREKEEKEKREKEERERVEKIEQLKKDANKYMNKNKEPGSKISTTQKTLNNLSATNNMFQIIMQILY